MLFYVVFTLIFFLHNISALISYDRKQLPDSITLIINLDLDEDFYFKRSAAMDVLLFLNQVLILGI